MTNRTALRGRALVVPTLLILGCLGLNAQVQHPPEATRNAIATALQQALSTRPDPADGSQYSDVNLGSVELLDPITGQCESVDPLVVRLIYHEDHFVLRRLVRGPGTLDPPFSHQLVTDLNQWLNAVWALNLRELHEFEEIPYECENEGQQFYTSATTDAGLVQAVREATGEQAILDRYYDINGTMVLGSDLVQFVPTNATRTIQYLTDLGDGTAASRRRLLSAAYLRVKCPDNGPSLEIWFDVRLDSYVDDCGIPGSYAHFRIEIGSLYACIVAPQYQASTNERNDSLVTLYLNAAGLWNEFPTPDQVYPGNIGGFGLTPEGRLVLRTHHRDDPKDLCGPYADSLCAIVNRQTPSDSCQSSYCYDGTFTVDDTKTLVFRYNTTSPCASCDAGDDAEVPCLIFCDSTAPGLTVTEGVLKAGAQTFSDNLPMVDEEKYPKFTSPRQVDLYAGQNSYQTGTRGKWRPARSFAYRAPTVGGTGLFAANPDYLSERAYNDAGTFTLQLFNWGWSEPPGTDTSQWRWLTTSSVRKYSYNGEPVEEVDLSGMPSAARFDYGQQLPVLVAKNASAGAVAFESYEGDGRAFEGITTATAHSGRYSFPVLTAPGWESLLGEAVAVDDRAAASGMLIRFWERHAYPVGNETLYDEHPPVELSFSSGAVTKTFASGDIRFVARTGAWSLFEVEVTNLSAGAYAVLVQTDGNGVQSWIDDVRVQPLESEMSCYVYDPATMRVTTTFDDQHFGVFFQYNGEGKLTRRLMETTNGLRTVQENQYHTPLTDRVSSGQGNSVLTRPSRRFAAGGRARTDGGDQPSGLQMAGDVVSVELTPESASLEIFGMTLDELARLDEDIARLFTTDDLDSLTPAQIENLRLIDDLEQVDAQLDSFGSMPSSDEQRELVQRTAARRADLIKRLDLDEDEANTLLRGVRKMRDAVEAAPTDQPADSSTSESPRQ